MMSIGFRLLAALCMVVAAGGCAGNVVEVAVRSEPVGSPDAGLERSPEPAAQPAPRAVRLVGGNFSTCAIINDGSVRCWGANRMGVLDLERRSREELPSPTQRADLSDIADLALGSGYCACALSRSGEVSCWGRGGSGQLGNGDTKNILTPQPVAGLGATKGIEMGGETTCALLEDGNARCWGPNGRGTVADGTRQQRLSPGAPFGPFVALSMYDDNACGVAPDGRVFCWGENAYGHLGPGQNQTEPNPTAPDHPTVYRGRPQPVPNITGARDVAVGGNFQCALIHDGTVHCWGWNSQGQIGEGTDINRLDGPVAPVRDLSNVTHLAAGLTHACAVSEGRVYCWGDNSHRQLATYRETRPWPEVVEGPHDVIDLIAGTYHSCALGQGGEIWCWGSNWYGGLGFGQPTRNGQRPGEVALFGPPPFPTDAQAPPPPAPTPSPNPVTSGVRLTSASHSSAVCDRRWRRAGLPQPTCPGAGDEAPQKLRREIGRLLDLAARRATYVDPAINLDGGGGVVLAISQVRVWDMPSKGNRRRVSVLYAVARTIEEDTRGCDDCGGTTVTSYCVPMQFFRSGKVHQLQVQSCLPPFSEADDFVPLDRRRPEGRIKFRPASPAFVPRRIVVD